jgi:ABC-type Fe3+-siderophore transport system permease subunit
LVAFLAAGMLCLLLLIALAVCSLLAQTTARRKVARPHLVGILSSLAADVIVLIAVVVTAVQSEGSLESNRVGAWLDRWLLLWVVAVLALWPIGALLYRRRQRAAGEQK